MPTTAGKIIMVFVLCNYAVINYLESYILMVNALNGNSKVPVLTVLFLFKYDEFQGHKTKQKYESSPLQAFF